MEGVELHHSTALWLNRRLAIASALRSGERSLIVQQQHTQSSHAGTADCRKGSNYSLMMKKDLSEKSAVSRPKQQIRYRKHREAKLTMDHKQNLELTEIHPEGANRMRFYNTGPIKLILGHLRRREFLLLYSLSRFHLSRTSRAVASTSNPASPTRRRTSDVRTLERKTHNAGETFAENEARRDEDEAKVFEVGGAAVLAVQRRGVRTRALAGIVERDEPADEASERKGRGIDEADSKGDPVDRQDVSDQIAAEHRQLSVP